MAARYDKKDELFHQIAQLNKLRFEGQECDGCEDSTVYQINEIAGVDAVSTPSDWRTVQELVDTAQGPSVSVSCCGCGTVHDIYILDPEGE